MKLVDRSERRYGRLVAKSKVPRPVNAYTHGWPDRRPSFWLCECDCGNKIVVSADSLRGPKGRRSCGCLIKDHIQNIRLTGAMARQARKVSVAPPAEEWRPVEGRPYEVSDLGRVRSLTKRGWGTVLKPTLDKKGYQGVTLYGLGKPFTVFVHTLVCSAFIGPKPSSEHGVAHWDGNPANNTVGNLRWATMKENLNDCIRHRTRQFGEQHSGVKLSENDIREIVRLSSNGLSQYKIAGMFGVTQPNISVILGHKSWRHLWGEPPNSRQRSKGYEQ